MRCFIILGGREYYGPTAERDAVVVKKLAIRLFEQYGNSVRIITGGAEGITDDFCVAWQEAGGKHICWIKMGSKEESFLDVLGDMKRVCCAIAIQGGAGTRHKLLELKEKDVPIVCFKGSGGAAGAFEEEEVATETDPNANVNDIVEAICKEVQRKERKYEWGFSLEEMERHYAYMGIAGK